MKNAVRTYNLLVRCYPRKYRDAFGAQMLQTFSDHYADVKESDGHVGVRFWSSLIADELPNQVRQRVAYLTESDGLLKVPVGRATAVAVFVLPLYATFCGLLVKLALALPHPPVSGIFAIIAMATVAIVLPGILSLMVSCLLASALASTVTKRTERRPRSR